MIKLTQAGALVAGASLFAALGGFAGLAGLLLVVGGAMLGIGLSRT